VRFINDEAVQLDLAYTNEFIEDSCKTNVIICRLYDSTSQVETVQLSEETRRKGSLL
jgi:hypothetical protein